MLTQSMNTYLVGGAVRDQLLDLPVKEKDWVVVGATPKIMEAQGFRAVGKDFPVFLHPETHEEYALARTERKTAPGYKGFHFRADTDVSLEQDLIRRDLTINAMALSPDGQLIDPYNGQQDLNKRVLRHVSPAFSEDPVRILRVARFAARYAHLGFTIADETLQLMQVMVNNGEVEHLVAERVWAETAKALSEITPSRFFQSLRDCDALAVIFPELENLFGVPQPVKYHPEVDTGVHILLTVDQAALLSDKLSVRFAALVHDLGKAVTPSENWPSHRQHETLGLPILEQLCQRLRVPNDYKQLAKLVMHYHTHSHRAFELRPKTLADMLAAVGAFKKNHRLDEFLLTCEADLKGRTGLETQAYLQADYIKGAQLAAMAVDTSDILAINLSGPEIGEAIFNLRVTAIAQYKKTQLSK
jgi:tRNA nucleotidyltransferase (CCA-adding enzyme)